MTIKEAICRLECHNYVNQQRLPHAVHLTEALNLAISILKDAEEQERKKRHCSDCAGKEGKG